MLFRSNQGVGLFLGTYYSSDASWRPEDYNVMYGGDYNGSWGVPENFISQYGPINTEAFVTQTISNQCFNQYDNYDSCPNVWDGIYLVDQDGIETHTAIIISASTAFAFSKIEG